MSGPIGNRNVSVHHVVRELVSRYLETRGFATTARPRQAKISSALDGGVRPDVSGVEGVFLDVTSRGTYRLSLDLDAARSGADVTGDRVAAFVQHRAGRPISDAFVVMSLADFATLATPTP